MEKIFTQAAFAIVLLLVVTLPLATYGCLALKDPPAIGAGEKAPVAPSSGETGRPGNP